MNKDEMLRRVNIFHVEWVKPKWLDKISQLQLVGALVGGGLLLVSIVALWPSDPEVTVIRDAPKKEEVVKEVVVSPAGVDDGHPDLAFYETYFDEWRLKLLAESSKTTDASANDYRRIHSMVTPLFADENLNEDKQFFERLVAIAMNDDVSPGFISAWEDVWIWGIYRAKKGYEAETKLKARKDELLRKYGKP